MQKGIAYIARRITRWGHFSPAFIGNPHLPVFYNTITTYAEYTIPHKYNQDIQRETCYNDIQEHHLIYERIAVMNKLSKNRVLRRKFFHFLLPTLAIMAVTPFNQIIESITISGTLGINAMASASLAYPLLLLSTAVYYFLGSGGAAEYTLALSEGDEKKAGSIFRLTILISALCGIFITLLAAVFIDPLSHLLCRDPSLYVDFRRYYCIVIYAIPPMIVFLTLTSLLVPLGKPGFAAGSVIAVALIQALMTYVYINFFRLQVEGAALARLTSFTTGTLVVLAGVMIYAPPLHISRDRITLQNLLARIFKKGNSEGISVSAMAFRFFWTFSIGAVNIGSDAVVAFSVCILAASVDSIIQGTFIGTSIPMIALLHSQHDYRSAERVLKTTIRMQFFLSALWFAVSYIIARPLARFFGIHDDLQIDTAVNVLRIYSFSYLFRGSYVLFRNYIKVLDIQTHAWKLTAASFIANGLFMICSFFGGNALWWANPISSLLLLLFTYLLNRRTVRKSSGRWRGILMIPREQEALQTINASFSLSREEIAAFGKQFQVMCEKNGMEKRNAVLSAFIAEELLLNVLEAKKRKDYADINARIYPDRMVIDFRTLGSAFRPEEMMLLRKISSNITHRNIGGMNCTRIVLERNPVSTAV